MNFVKIFESYYKSFHGIICIVEILDRNHIHFLSVGGNTNFLKEAFLGYIIAAPKESDEILNMLQAVV